MSRPGDARRHHPVLRRTRVLLWCQLAAGLIGLVAIASALMMSGSIRIGGWWPLLDSAVTAAAAAAALGYVLRAERPRRAVLIGALLLPVVYTAAFFLGPLSVDTGTGIRSGGFGWFAYSSSPSAMRLIEITLQVVTAGLLATMLAKLAMLVNAVLLLLPASREAFRPAAPPDRPDAS